MKIALFIGIGGFFGSASRYLLGQQFIKLLPSFNGTSTFIINILGSLLLGLLVHAAGKMEKEYFFMLTTGFCGGFTTFSTFSVENMNFILNGQYSIAAGYMIASTIFGLSAAILGWYVGKLLFI